MAFTSTIQYWFFSIFMQFVPLNELEEGNTFTYSVSDAEYNMLIELEEMTFKSMEDIIWKFNIKYDGKAAPFSRHSAVLAYTPENQMHFTSYKDSDREMLSEGDIARFPKHGTGLIVSTDDKYIIKPVRSYETEIETSKGKLSCNKKIFKNEDMTVEIYHDEMFGLIRVVIMDKMMDNPVEISRIK